MEKQIIIDCKEDNKFEGDRKITHSCNREFVLEETNIFCVETLGYFDDILEQYYTICPHCGYLVLLDEKELSNELKQEAKQSYHDDPYQYRKNSLKSQLIYWENMAPKVSTKVRARALY